MALASRENFAEWRAGLIAKRLSPTSATRYAKSLASALNLAASNSRAIDNVRAWTDGLAAVDGESADDAIVRDDLILSDQTIVAIVLAAYTDGRANGDAFGELIEVMASSGVRDSQVIRLKVRDLRDADRLAP